MRTRRAYEPTDEQVCGALDDLRKTAAELFGSGPEGLMPSYVLGIVGHRLGMIAEADSPATRAAHVREARATLKAYAAWVSERRPDDGDGREAPDH